MNKPQNPYIGLLVGLAVLMGTALVFTLVERIKQEDQNRSAISQRAEAICAMEACDQKDLTAQVRAADASEYNADLAAWQAALNAVSIVIVGGSLGLTAIATKSAIDATIAAQDTVEISKETSKKQLRSYISAVPDFAQSFDQNSFSQIKFTLRNHGSTPAHDVRHKAHVTLVEDPKEFSPPEEINADFSSKHVIFPNGASVGQWGADKKFTAEEIRLILERKLYITIYGVVTYADIFDEIHETRFCSFISTGQDHLQKLVSNYEKSDLIINFMISPAGNTAT